MKVQCLKGTKASDGMRVIRPGSTVTKEVIDVNSVLELLRYQYIVGMYGGFLYIVTYAWF
jgi:hypothetical protein